MTFLAGIAGEVKQAICDFLRPEYRALAPQKFYSTAFHRLNITASGLSLLRAVAPCRRGPFPRRHLSVSNDGLAIVPVARRDDRFPGPVFPAGHLQSVEAGGPHPRVAGVVS